MNKDVRLISISNIRCTLQKMLKCIHIMLGGFSVLQTQCQHLGKFGFLEEVSTISTIHSKIF